MRIRKIMVGAVIAVLAALMTALPVLAKETTDISHGSEQPVSCIADAVSSVQDAKTKKEKARSNDEAEAEQAFKANPKTLLGSRELPLHFSSSPMPFILLRREKAPLSFPRGRWRQCFLFFACCLSPFWRE